MRPAAAFLAAMKGTRASSKMVHAKYAISMVWKILAAGSSAKGLGKRRSPLALRRLVCSDDVFT
jgi:hypothetical protein